jgi:DNA-binding GntR family transcriptional regulator
MMVVPGSIADPIFDTIKDRILEGELKPGTKLGEEEIAVIFAVGRARARQSLRLLAAIGIVTIHPNRGAFVASPTRIEAAQIYAARRMLECPAVAHVAEFHSSQSLTALRAQVDDQRKAVLESDTGRFLHSTFAFHSLLASMADNPVIEILINQLLARSALISSLYELSSPTHETVDDHVALIELIASRDASGASKFMEKHLKHVETWLQTEPIAEMKADLRSVLQRR